MLINWLFPKQCINCEKVGDYLCRDCKQHLEPHIEICPYCHKYSFDYQTCLDCKQNKNNYLEGIIIPFYYQGLLKKLILKLKFYHQKDITQFLVDRLSISLQIHNKLSNIKNIVVSFVPSHRRRHHFTKGYNQSLELAKLFADKNGFRLSSFTKKIKHTKSQTKLSREKRLKNLKNAFIFDTKEILEGDETILIIDDITTTGSTINEIAKNIKEIYPKTKIWGLVVGRHNN